MTTNHLDSLDAALIRPGRADVHLLIDNASQEQVAGMLRRFWPQWEPGKVQALAQQIPAHQLSMARIQEFLLERRNTPEAVVKDWSLLVQEFYRGLFTLDSA